MVRLVGWFGFWMIWALGCTEPAPSVSPPPAVVVAESPPPAFDAVMAEARTGRWHEKPFGALMQTVAEHFIGAPYQAGLLDQGETETLHLGLEGFDCVLFIEAVLALARGVAVEDYTYTTYAQHIEEQRYRGGEMNGYCSRLHYFSEWIADNETRGTVQNVTSTLGGEPLDKTLNFMGTHRASYPRMATDDTQFQCILDMETRLAPLAITHIPQARIAGQYPHMAAGDLVAMTTHIAGLDVTHTGLVYKYPDGRTGLIHASVSGEVKISPDLQTYVEDVSSQIGITVARAVDPR